MSNQSQIRAKSANGKIRYALFVKPSQAKSSQVKPSQVNQLIQSLNHVPVYTWARSSHVGVLKGNPRRVYLCAVFVCVVWEVHRPTITDNGDPVAVSLCGLHRPATSAYSKEIPGKLLACCVRV